MSAPADEIISEVARQVQSALQQQQQTGAAAAADAYAAQQRQGKTSNRILYSGGGGLILAMATAMGWVMDKVDEWDTAQAVQTQILHRIEAIEKRQKILQGRQLQLGRRVIATEIAMTDGFVWIGLKIDAGTSKKSRQIGAPDSLDAARTRAKNVRANRRLDELFGSDTLDVLTDDGALLPLDQATE